MLNEMVQHRFTFHWQLAIFVGEKKCKRKIKIFSLLYIPHNFRLRHLSIIKTKQCDYKYKLEPYNPVEIDNNIEYCKCIIRSFYFFILIKTICLDTLPDEERLTIAQKAKRFDEDYETNAYRIVCELVIKQKDRWFLTDLYCETHTVTDSP